MLRTLPALFALLAALWSATSASAQTVLPPGFAESTVWGGLETPTVVRFAPDGRAFVASKAGTISVFDGVDDPSPALYADLRERVFDGWDRGLLGMAIDPQFANGRPYVYVLYAHDRPWGNPMLPRWGDTCPTPPGATEDGCTISGRLSRLGPFGAETVLIEDFCQQYPSHSMGSVEFGPDGQLYVSAGEGASFNWADYGQRANTCGDPPGPAGTGMEPPHAQGGALRAQSFRRPASQPASLDGAILRVDPDTGAASAGNPASGNADPNRRRIVAHGFRNPFRFTFRPGTGEIFAGDVGWNGWEEINRVQNLARVRNYGWPCYEGVPRMMTYDAQDVTSCETLYDEGPSAVTEPYFTYGHFDQVVPGEDCPVPSSSISALHFYTGDQFPARYRGALFFADYARQCIWVAFKDADGLPDMSTRETFATKAGGPVWLTQGPDGALYYADVFGGKVRRIAAFNQSPTARITASPTGGAPPLTVHFDGTGSTDPEDDPLTYAWDLDGDGAYDDSTASKPSFSYTRRGPVTVRLRVADSGGRQGTTSTEITVGVPPAVTIDTPTAARTWRAGETIAFAGTARDSTGAELPASALVWSLTLRHCGRTDANVCHTHAIQDFAGVRSGSFTAPDHEYPSYLQLSLTAVDGDDLRTTRTVRLDPRTAQVTVSSDPPGIPLTLGSETLPAPFTHTVIARSVNTLSGATRLGFRDAEFTWQGWSDGLAPSHLITAPDAGQVSYTATYTRPPRTSLAGAEIVGSGVPTSTPGFGNLYYMVAGAGGTARSLRVYLDATSTASRFVLGLYSDESINPSRLLGSAVVTNPVAGAWNAVTLPAGIPIEAGRGYWLAVFNPPEATGVLAWRDRAGGQELGQWTVAEGLRELPATWVTFSGYWHSDGHVSGGAWAEVAPTPTPSPTPTPTPTPTATVPPLPTAQPTPTTVPDDPPAPPAPVGAWGFDEPSGARAADAAGGRAGTISGARRVFGRFGRGLSFDGRDDWVTVPNAPRLTTALTVEGWVYATRRRDWSTLAVQETDSGLAWGLYPFGSRGRAAGLAGTRSAEGAKAPPLRRWTHLAVTYDGRAIRTYVDGRLVATRAHSGRLATSAQPLRFGGNAVWPEWFAGRLDEIRVYDRALTAAQIQADMARPIAGPTRGSGGAIGKGAKVERFRGRGRHRAT